MPVRTPRHRYCTCPVTKPEEGQLRCYFAHLSEHATPDWYLVACMPCSISGTMKLQLDSPEHKLHPTQDSSTFFKSSRLLNYWDTTCTASVIRKGSWIMSAMSANNKDLAMVACKSEANLKRQLLETLPLRPTERVHGTLQTLIMSAHRLLLSEK